MASHFLPLAPSSTLVERNLIASPSPRQCISSALVVMCRRVAPAASVLVLKAVRWLVWNGLQGVMCRVFMGINGPEKNESTRVNFFAWS